MPRRNHKEAHRSWKDMRRRCGDPRHKSYHNYGGRGIRVCDRWRKFAEFFEDMGDRLPGMSLDRINNDGDYEPGNCRWATAFEQVHNSRRVKLVEFHGETRCIRAWGRHFGVSMSTIRNRLGKGLPLNGAKP